MENLYKGKTHYLYCEECKKACEHTEWLDRPRGGYFVGISCSCCGFVTKERMKFYEKHAYEHNCDNCGKKHTLLAVEDEGYGYSTGVHIVCDCGELVEFSVRTYE